MRAVVYEKYGPADVLSVKERPRPVPRGNEVLIAVQATTVTSGDFRARSLTLPPGFGFLGRLVFGVFGPRQPILGTELAGRVEAVGPKVTKFQVGDEVFAFPGAKMGGYAEYRCLPEDGPLARKPGKLTFQQAAALSFGGVTALNFLRRGKVKRGDKVLVNGASGGVGTACVQIAKHFGAEVTGVCSTANAELVRSIGADRVIDYTKEDFASERGAYDVVVDTVGTAPWSRSAPALKDGGRLLLVLSGMGDMLRAPWVALTGSKRIIAGPVSARVEQLEYIARLAEAGEYVPVIDRVYELEQTVEAHRYVDTGRKRGNVVVAVAHAA